MVYIVILSITKGVDDFALENRSYIDDVILTTLVLVTRKNIVSFDDLKESSVPLYDRTFV